eukprot:TRINITY_DN1354_c0_g1_i2.p1 TRINITY_DN1354_c0_g1~~TRINITY_DN1354_c0_g1_i2.p1  ORF type:complete len:232 (-),score=47.76 TRINITY_DN1354_c0_g1_i2:230-925(-)
MRFLVLAVALAGAVAGNAPDYLDAHAAHMHDGRLLTHPRYTTQFENVEAYDFDYIVDGAVYEGYVAYPSGATTPLPGTLIAHQWMGLGDYEKYRARQWASFGYIAFASDMYGKGIRPTNSDEARGNTTYLRENPLVMRQRAQGSLQALLSFNLSNPQKIAQFGYCFGGHTTLELARDGADIKATAVYHGSLNQLIDDPAFNNILGAVSVHHGDLDDGCYVSLMCVWLVFVV